jgi:two-component system phosphate regulon response regulator OmpR
MSETATAPKSPWREDAPHILVVDDDTRLRRLLKRYLADNGYLASAAQDATEARALMRGLIFDLLVVDIMMPGETGLTFTESVHDKSNVPILLLTARGEPEDRIAGLESGADDYLSKPFEPRELLLRIGAILKRAQSAGGRRQALTLGRWGVDLERGELLAEGRRVRLTSAELALLRILAHNPRKSFSRIALAEATGAGQERSVDVQITRLRRKIEQDPRAPRYLRTVRGVGYALVPD